MMIFVDFDELDTFNCTYGFSEEKSGALRVFVEGGLAFPYGMFLKEENGVRFFKCEKDNSENVGRYFQDTIFTIHQGGLNMLNGS
ncbi:hypothetical protein P4238_14660 [Pseudomonas aeruginosa]|nr:hypothetical protein [Pseudomonas aeruginosa]